MLRENAEKLKALAPLHNSIRKIINFYVILGRCSIYIVKYNLTTFRHSDTTNVYICTFSSTKHE